MPPPRPVRSSSDVRRLPSITPPSCLSRKPQYPVVGLMGSTLSRHQADLFADHFDRVVLMLDGDESGRQGAISIAQTLAVRVSVLLPIVLGNGRQPDQLTPRQIVDVLSTALVRAV